MIGWDARFFEMVWHNNLLAIKLWIDVPGSGTPWTAFPHHDLEIVHLGHWRYFSFRGHAARGGTTRRPLGSSGSLTLADRRA
jgi:hypothetical protein